MLESEDPAAPLVPSKRPKCTRCQEHQEDKVGRQVPKIPWSFEEHDAAAQEKILAQGHQPLQDRPAYAYGVIAQEVFAGSGRWSEAMKEAGHKVLDPIEVYEDPLRQKGYRAHHDLKNPEVRKRLLDQARELPGPEVPNVYHLGTPCTSYCDFNLLNGGTRIYDQPQGDPERRTPSEEEGNLFCDFTCELCFEAYQHDKEFVIENTMPTGRYPKLWDQPALQRLQRATGALFVPAHLCEWGLSPPDQPAKRYKKGQWNLVSPGIYAYALLLARPCRHQHQHEQIKGSAPGTSYPRTREAQVYPEALCKAWAIIYTAAHKGWGPRPILGKLARLAEPQQQLPGGQGGEDPNERIRTQALEAITQRRKQPPDPDPPTTRSEEVVGAREDEGEPEIQPEENVEEHVGDEEPDGTCEGRDPQPGEEQDAQVGEPEASREDSDGSEQFLSLGSDSSETPPGDDWSFDPDQGRLWRWHRTERRDLFGHREEDWEGCPVPLGELSCDRRTAVWRGDQLIGYIEDSLSNTERPESCNEPWVGYTAFRTLAALEARDREEAEARACEAEENEEEPDANGPCVDTQEESEGEESPEDDDSAMGDDANGAEEEGSGDSTTHAPPSDASTLRSRSPVGDESRRVGYIAHSPVLEELCGGREDEIGEIREAARDYIGWCTGGTRYSAESVKEAARRGDRLLELAGGLPKAMEALRQARQEAVGEPLRGVLSDEAKACVSEDHYAYLEEMVNDGIPARREYVRRRVKADPYPSALEHLDELYEKSWKDAKWGIVLYCTDATEGQTSDLVECPQGRVPKQLPDRSISSEGRPIHAMLVANAATHKHHHPPALQPRHRQIARKALWWAYRHPGISCTLAKLDVSRAFKWHDIRPEDAGDFGSALPGKPVGVEGRVKMVYGGMPFGWTGAPGEYMIFALAGRAIHESYRPDFAGP